MGEGVIGEVGGGRGAIDLISAIWKHTILCVHIMCHESLISRVTTILQTFLELFYTVFNCPLNILRLFVHLKTCLLRRFHD